MTTKKQTEAAKNAIENPKRDTVVINNSVGTRVARLGKNGERQQLILPGKNTFTLKVWGEVKGSKEGRELIEAKILTNLTEEAAKKTAAKKTAAKKAADK